MLDASAFVLGWGVVGCCVNCDMAADICHQNILCLATVDCHGRIVKLHLDGEHVLFGDGGLSSDCRGRVPGWYLDWRLLVDIQIVFKTEYWGDSEGCSALSHECKGWRAIDADCCMSKRKMVVHV